MTRSQKVLAVVAVLIVALYVTGLSTQQSGQSDPTENGLMKMLGDWFGGPDSVAKDELSATCSAIEASCVISVKPSDKDLRELLLKADKPMRVVTRAPHGDSMVDKDLAAGEEVKVAVDSNGADIILTCSKCTVTVGG